MGIPSDIIIEICKHTPFQDVLSLGAALRLTIPIDSKYHINQVIQYLTDKLRITESLLPNNAIVDRIIGLQHFHHITDENIQRLFVKAFALDSLPVMNICLQTGRCDLSAYGAPSHVISNDYSGTADRESLLTVHQLVYGNYLFDTLNKRLVPWSSLTCDACQGPVIPKSEVTNFCMIFGCKKTDCNGQTRLGKNNHIFLRIAKRFSQEAYELIDEYN